LRDDVWQLLSSAGSDGLLTVGDGFKNNKEMLSHAGEGAAAAELAACGDGLK